MIKFFRKIRQKLLSENKFSRYLIYAIGEIVLVVIGILIALQINNWNEERKEAVRQTKHIEQLLQDARIDSVFYTSRLDHFARQLKAYKELIGMCDAGAVRAEDKVPLPSGERPFQLAASQSNVLVNTDAYTQISDRSIKTILRDYTINYSFITKANDLHTEIVSEELRAYIKKYNLILLQEEEPEIGLDRFFPICADDNLEGVVQICYGFTMNAKQTTERFLATNQALIQECQSYLNR